MKKLISAFCCMLILAACNTGTQKETVAGDSASTVPIANADENKEERNKEIAMESIKAVINNNADEALKNVDPNAIDYYDGSGKPVKGVDSIKAGMKMWMNNIQDYRGKDLEAVADGNKVYVYGEWSGTFKGDFMKMKVAGKKFDVKDVDIFTFNDAGKITEHRSVQSMAGMMAALTEGKK